MNKKMLIVVAAIIVVTFLIFFWPKQCGNWGTGIGTSLEDAAIYKNCDCLGFKYREPLTGGGYDYCYGVCSAETCECTAVFREPTEGAAIQRVIVDCPMTA